MFALHVDPDQAVIDPFEPKVVREQYLTTEKIIEWLARKGVTHGVDRAAVESMIRMSKGELPPSKSIVVAQSTAPREGPPARIEHKFRMGQIVARGDVLVAKHPPGTGEPGLSVTGEEIPGILGAEVRMRPGRRVTIGQDGASCVAATYGVVQIQEDLVDVAPLVRISEDGMLAWIDVYPKTDSGRAIEVETVRDALRHEGVVFGVDEEEIRRVIEEATRTRRPVEGAVGARGKDARPGSDTWYDYRFKVMGMNPEEAATARSRPGFDPSRATLDLVRQGDVLAIKNPLVEPVEGKTVRGERLECPPVRSAVLVPRDNVELSEDQLTYRATVPICGYPDYQDNSIYVRSPLAVSADAMEATLTVQPPDSKGAMLDRLLIERLLTNAGVVYGIQWPVVDAILREARESGLPVADRAVALGKPAAPGADGRIEYRVDIEKRVGTRRADGSIDFYEQGTIKNVEEGEALLEIVPPEIGQPGMTLRGEEIPATSGKEVRLQAAQNVQLSPDGRLFTATKGGLLMVTKTHVGVFDSYAVQGNVDFSTGNIRFEHGSVTISGSVQSTFRVSAKSHVFVQDTINDSVVTCRGDIEAGRGIVQAGKGYVRAGGSIRCLFAHNARLWAEGDIEVHQSAVNCQLVAGGRIHVAGKGRVIGGEAKAREGLDCIDLGSELCVETLVVVGSEYEVIDTLKKEMTKLGEDIGKVDQALGEERTLDDLYLYPADKRELFRKLIVYRERARQKMRDLQAERERIIEDSKGKEKAGVRVEGTIYPGVVITILDKHLSVDKELKHVAVYYHRERDEIVTDLLRT